MYQKILLPLDGSERAEKIFPNVESLATQFGSKLELLYVIEPIWVSYPDNIITPIVDEIDKQTKWAEGYLETTCESFRAKGIEAEFQIIFGSVVNAIMAVAEDEDVDLIAIASHGRGGLGRAFYGSVAVGVLHRAERPLLLVRAQN